MHSFLQEKIYQIQESHADHLDEISIILPNKRASVYIHKYLSEKIGKAFFAPEIITINEWVQQHCELTILQQSELVFIAYTIHQELQKKSAESFDDFLKWGKIMLSDFDEIDRYMVSPEKIFRDLRNIKEIENWSFNSEELSEGQKKFMGLWDLLPEYYKRLNTVLANQKATYQGKAYQLVAQNIESIANTKKHYYFIGFNALSESEERMITGLIKLKKATFLSDIDSFYFSNKNHEAGHFYRQICDKWMMKPVVGNKFNEIPKQIEIIETSQQIGQTKIAGNIVKQLLESGNNLTNTAIVLADESLLIPLTRSLPYQLESVNITMGYPIKFSHLKSLIDLIFDLQFNFQKFSSSRLYHKTLLRILDHSFIAAIIDDEKLIQGIEKLMTEKNRVFLEWTELEDLVPHLKTLNKVFCWWEKPAKDGFAAMNQLIDALYQNLSQQTTDTKIDLEILYHFSKSFKKFEDIFTAYNHPLNLKSYKRLFYQFWQSESLSFLGNPINGLQVMGILETRVLDFENLIILGMNEGNLPQANISNSFIPYDLKLEEKLPTDEDRQAIFAHHFYRLLHRAKNIYMTYNSGTDDMGGAEKSRFITQLENELDRSKGHTITQSAFNSNDKSAEISKVTYSSTKEVHQKLDAYFEKGLSPSALNKLINCPLDFYYRYILEMKENVQVEENIESSTFGTKIHDVLEQIFRVNFFEKNLALDATILEAEKKNIPIYLREKYLEQFSESDIKYGQNKLSFEVSLQFLSKFIDEQIKEIKKSKSSIFIVDLEKEDFESIYNWNINGETKKIKIAGKADRIDSIGNSYRIVDYKSGKCDKDKVTISEKHIGEGGMNQLMHHKDKGYARQLLMYALMYRTCYPDKQPFSAGIISMVNLKEWLQNVRIGAKGDELLSNDILNNFEAELKLTIENLYQNDFIFEHNPNSMYCEHCEN